MYELDYKPLNTYEVPGQILGMLVDQKLSVKSGGRVLREWFSGEPLLTPLERDDITNKVKMAFGPSDNRALDTLVEVMTNPLTYLAFLPVAGSAARFALGTPKFSAWSRRYSTILGSLGLSPALSQLRGTPLPVAMQTVTDNMKSFSDGTIRKVGGVHKEALRARKAAGLSDKISPDDQALMQIYLEGLNKPRQIDRFTGLTVDRNTSKIVLKAPKNAKVQDALVDMTDAELEKALRDNHLWDLTQAIRDDQIRVRDAVFGATRAERVQNAQRLYYSMRGVGGSTGAFSGSNHAKVVMQSLFGHKAEKLQAQIMAGKRPVVKQRIGNRVVSTKVDMTPDEWINLMADAMDLHVANKHYVPRNVYHNFDAAGNIIDTATVSRKAASGGLVASTATLVRVAEDTAFDPETMLRLSQLQARYTGRTAATQGWTDWYTKSRNFTADANRPNLRRRIDVIQGHSKYVGSMASTKALFIDKIDKGVLDMEAELLNRYTAWQVKNPKAPVVTGSLRTAGMSGTVDQKTGKFIPNKPADIWKPLRDALPEETPLGGFTYADMIDRAYRLIPQGNGAARDLVSAYILPRILGQTSIHSTAMTALAIRSRDAVSNLLASPVGQWLEKSIPGLHAPLKSIADKTITQYTGNEIESRISSYLYGTHLGVNLKSVVFNLFQPLVTAPSFATAGEIGEGYVNGLKSLFSYYKEMFKNPSKFLDTQATSQLRQKHFKELDELAGLSDDLLGQLDIGKAQSVQVLNDGRMSFNQKLMLVFQQGELSNRVIMGEIAKARLKRQGLSLGSAQAGIRTMAREEVRQVVEETQFGASLMNTIGAAYGQGFMGRILGVPLLRQFMTFPLRMSLLPFNTISQLDEKAVRNVLFGVGRSVGWSAIAYETLKSGFGFDASDYLYVGASTQLAGGVIDDRDGPLPIPPAISIPANLLKGLAAGDGEVIANETMRLIPGGVAAARFIKAIDPSGFLAPTPPGAAAVYPYNRVMWDQADENGAVPIYDPSGKLITKDKPLNIVLRAAGLDFGKFQDQAALDNYLVKQRDQIVAAQQAIITATINGDHGRAQKLAREFQKRFGFAPKIERSQFQNALKNREMSRTDRILSRLNPEVRDFYAAQVAQIRGTEPNTTAPDTKAEAANAAAVLEQLMLRTGGL